MNWTQWTDTYKQNNAALKWFRQVQETVGADRRLPLNTPQWR